MKRWLTVNHWIWGRHWRFRETKSNCSELPVLLLIKNLPPDSFPFLGFRDFTNTGSDTSLFLALDGSSVEFITAGNKPPWGSTQPSNTDGREFCGSILADEGQLNDLACDRVSHSVCERPCEVPVDAAFLFDDCIDGTQLFLNPNRKSFSAAQESCKTFGNTAHLAIPTTATKFERMQNLVQNSSSNTNFIGLRSFDEVSITTGFLTIENSLNAFTSGALGSFPWAPGEPDGINSELSCASISTTDLQLIEDVSCENTAPSLCERHCEVRPNFVF